MGDTASYAITRLSAKLMKTSDIVRTKNFRIPRIYIFGQSLLRE